MYINYAIVAEFYKVIQRMHILGLIGSKSIFLFLILLLTMNPVSNVCCFKSQLYNIVQSFLSTIPTNTSTLYLSISSIRVLVAPGLYSILTFQ